MIDRPTEQRGSRNWRDQAECRDVTTDLFFPTGESGPDHDAQVTAAKAVCARCRVRAECLTEALGRIPYGIAGGLTEQERRQLRRPTTGRNNSVSRGASTVVDAVLADGQPPGMTARERARVGRMLLAAGRTTRQVATDCGVCPRTVQRWATPNTGDTRPSSAGASTACPGGAGERSRGGNRAPLRTSHPHNPWQGHEQRKDTEDR
jgi:Transcription factor WhiB/Homeodomain-like domain